MHIKVRRSQCQCTCTNMKCNSTLFFQVFSVAKVKTVCRVIRHMDVITCLSLDHGGNFLMSGSRDTTSIIWDVWSAESGGGGNGGGGNSGGAGSNGAYGETPNPRPIQVLSGHDRAVSCVAISTELDMAVSGSGTYAYSSQVPCQLSLCIPITIL